MRIILLALVASLIAGLAIGTWLRMRLEAPAEPFFVRTSPSAAHAALSACADSRRTVRLPTQALDHRATG